MIDLITVIKANLVHWQGVLARVLAVLLLSVSTINSPAFAEIPKLLSVTQTGTQESESEPKAMTPEQQRKSTKRALTEAQRDRTLSASRGISLQDAQERYRLLDGLVTGLNSQLNLIDEREELRRTRSAVEHKAKSWTGFPDPPPYSILLVDELMGSVLSARSKAQGLSTNQELLA